MARWDWFFWYSGHGTGWIFGEGDRGPIGKFGLGNWELCVAKFLARGGCLGVLFLCKWLIFC